MTNLPTASDILARIPTVRSLQINELDPIRTWVFEKTQALQDDITRYIEKGDYKEDPDVFQERLYKYHLLCGGMSGLATSLYEKAYFLHFKDITENSRTASTDNKAKLTAGDREIYAKGEVADIKGLKTLLDEVIKNLETRLYGCRTSNRK
jgi:hypothetical protein